MLRLADSPAAWKGDVLVRRTDWIHQLTDVEIAEIDAALGAVRDLPLAEIGPAEFPLPTLGPTIAEWAAELADGRGFLLVRGLPVARYTEQEAGIVYWGIGAHLGVPVPQNNDGDLLGHVRDTGEDPADPAVRRYRTRGAQPFHTDGADIVGLLCLATSRSGGESSIASSVTVFSEMQRRRPDLVDLFFEPWTFDLYEQQAPGEQPYMTLPLATAFAGRLFTMYIRFYIEQAQRHPEVPRLTSRHIEFLDLVDALAAEHRLDMEFRPGDIQLLSNAVILHGRTGYEDVPGYPRHLLRLWLSRRR